MDLELPDPGVELRDMDKRISLVIPGELWSNILDVLPRYGYTPRDDPYELNWRPALKKLLLDSLSQGVNGEKWYGSELERLRRRKG